MSLKSNLRMESLSTKKELLSIDGSEKRVCFAVNGSEILPRSINSFLIKSK